MNTVADIEFKVKGKSVSVPMSKVNALPEAERAKAYQRLRTLGSTVAGFSAMETPKMPPTVMATRARSPSPKPEPKKSADDRESLVLKIKDIAAEMRKRFKESGFKAAYKGKADLMKRLKTLYEQLLIVVGKGERQGPAVFFDAIREAPDSLAVDIKIKEMVHGKTKFSDFATERGLVD